MAKEKDKSTAFLYIAKRHQTLSTLYMNTRGNFVFYSICMTSVYSLLPEQYSSCRSKEAIFGKLRAFVSGMGNMFCRTPLSGSPDNAGAALAGELRWCCWWRQCSRGLMSGCSVVNYINHPLHRWLVNRFHYWSLDCRSCNRLGRDSSFRFHKWKQRETSVHLLVDAVNCFEFVLFLLFLFSFHLLLTALPNILSQWAR